MPPTEAGWRDDARIGAQSGHSNLPDDWVRRACRVSQAVRTPQKFFAWSVWLEPLKASFAGSARLVEFVPMIGAIVPKDAAGHHW